MSDQTASNKGHQRPAGSHPGGEPALDESVSVEPTVGWHCTHSFYRFDRARLAQLTDAERAEGLVAFKEALNEESASSPTRLQKWIVPGHKADFAIMALDPCPHAVDSTHQRLLAGPLWPALESTYSFVGLTEVSEYLPTAEQFAAKLVKQGEDPESASYKARVKGYAAREPAMQKARLEPDFPP